MAGLAGIFQPFSMKSMKTDVTKQNHIIQMYWKACDKGAGNRITDHMVQIFAATKGGGTMMKLLSEIPTKEFENDLEYYWDIIGTVKRNIPLVEARRGDRTVVTPDDTTPVGAGTEPFYLVFAEDWFFKGEVIFGNFNEVYPFRILENPSFEGTNAVYKVELEN